MLTSLGMALPQCEEDFFRQEKKKFLSWYEAARHVVFTLNRLVQDCTTPDPFCMPLIDDILDCVGECKFLSKIDLAKGFYKVPIDPKDRDKTAFALLLASIVFF